MLTGFKTLLFNLIMGGIMLLVQRYGIDCTDADIKPVVDALVTVAWAGGNIVLRWFTNTTMFKKTSPAPMPEGE